MFAPREHGGTNHRRGTVHPTHTEWSWRKGDEDEVSRAHTESSVPGTGTFSISNDGSVLRRRRRQYTPEERLQVAERRRIGVCAKCKKSRTKCTHDPPSNATTKFREDTQSHEMFALGMTTSSVAANEQGHVQVIGEMIAAIDNKLNTDLPIGETIRRPRPKTSQRSLRDAASKSEYKPLRPNTELSRSRKSTTTIHHDQEPALAKLGLEQGVIKPFRFKDNGKPKQKNRRLKAKPMASSNTTADSACPKMLIHEEGDDQIAPLLGHPPYCDGVQPYGPFRSVASSKIPRQTGHPYTTSGHNIPEFSQPAPANTLQVQYHYSQDAGLPRGLLSGLCEDGAVGFHQFKNTGYPQFPPVVTSIPQPPVIRQHLPGVPATISYYKGQPQLLGNDVGYVQALNEDNSKRKHYVADTTFASSSKVDWDQRTVVADSPDLVVSLLQDSGYPKLGRNELDWVPTGGFASNTSLF